MIKYRCKEVLFMDGESFLILFTTPFTIMSISEFCNRGCLAFYNKGHSERPLFVKKRYEALKGILSSKLSYTVFENSDALNKMTDDEKVLYLELNGYEKVEVPNDSC